MDEVSLDVLIFGGGVAGLWLLDEAVRRGHDAALLECGSLGGAQTGWSQGIIHGGQKYALGGEASRSAEAIREMPGVWRACLAGEREPKLTRTRLRAPHCHLWRTESILSGLGMLGARAALRVTPVAVRGEDRPAALRGCPGEVARLDEQVIDPFSLVEDLASRHAGRIVRAPAGGVALETRGAGDVERVVVQGAGGRTLTLRAARVVFCAGRGNEGLRERAGLGAEACQVRPLHMAMARGELPELNGHCVDGASVRVTITSTRDARGARVWQIGGRVAEEGVGLGPADQAARARAEVAATLPGVDLSGAEWAAYRADRAEAASPRGRRPETEVFRAEGNTLTAWPTKLALAPRLAESIVRELGEPRGRSGVVDALAGWERPGVALAPWDGGASWRSFP
jgi:glycine/D-amino acid oxidase-like deaminating enzyme